jgi:hypothetical protein
MKKKRDGNSSQICIYFINAHQHQMFSFCDIHVNEFYKNHKEGTLPTQASESHFRGHIHSPRRRREKMTFFFFWGISDICGRGQGSQNFKPPCLKYTGKPFQFGTKHLHPQRNKLKSICSCRYLRECEKHWVRR